MYLLDREEMTNLEAQTIDNLGVSGAILMENAGIQVVRVLGEEFGQLSGKKVTILAGKGNNGGDGFVIARHLINLGAEVKVLLFADEARISGDAELNLGILKRMGQKLIPIETENLNILRVAMVWADFVVDAIYGTGFQGAVSPELAAAMEIVNSSKKDVVSVDIPSGLEANTGKVHNKAIKAKVTVTFAFPKVGLYINKGPIYAGKVQVVDISIPKNVVDTFSFKKSLITEELVKGQMPDRSFDGHKGTYGHTLTIAGSPGMTGAAYLAAKGALRSGSGLVTLATPKSLNPILEVKLTEAMTIPLPENPRGVLSVESIEHLLPFLDKVNVVALGPGLGQDPDTAQFIYDLLPEVKVPIVLDADGLNALAKKIGLLAGIKAPLVITPHPGEMARLLDISIEEVEKNRVQVAQRTAEEWQVTVILKGAPTIVATPQGQLYINTTGNPGMATGGTGDVLTGLVAGFIAQGLNVSMAAVLATYIHGEAGDLAAIEKGYMGLIAEDLLEKLPSITKKLSKGCY